MSNDDKENIPEGYYRVDGKVIPFQQTAEDAVRVLLQFTGEDIQREGLRDTPSRVVKALMEMTQGYRDDPKEILSRVFEDTYDELILLRGIPFTSICEHHILQVSGSVDVGYIPNKHSPGVVGLSKLARLVDCFSRRLTLQERMTREIAAAIQEHLSPQAVGVIVRAEHSCMSCRGVKKHGTKMLTSCLLGAFRTQPDARAEFLSLCRDGDV